MSSGHSGYPKFHWNDPTRRSCFRPQSQEEVRWRHMERYRSDRQREARRAGRRQEVDEGLPPAYDLLYRDVAREMDTRQEQQHTRDRIARRQSITSSDQALQQQAEQKQQTLYRSSSSGRNTVTMSSTQPAQQPQQRPSAFQPVETAYQQSSLTVRPGATSINETSPSVADDWDQPPPPPQGINRPPTYNTSQREYEYSQQRWGYRRHSDE